MKGVLCNQSVVKNILAGTQTQDRRPMRVQPEIIKHADEGSHIEWGKYQFDFISDLLPYAPSQVGDILYVRETIYKGDSGNFYWAANRKGVGIDVFNGLCAMGWRNKKTIPSIHMPKWAARIFLEVTGVRCERVQDISTGDCCKEGVTTLTELNMALSRTDETPFDVQNRNRARKLFGTLWNTLYPGSWERNDWVWVRTFKMVEKPND